MTRASSTLASLMLRRLRSRASAPSLRSATSRFHSAALASALVSAFSASSTPAAEIATSQVSGGWRARRR